MKFWLIPLKNKARCEPESQLLLCGLMDIINYDHKTDATSSEELKRKNSFFVEDRGGIALSHQLQEMLKSH